MAYWTDEEGRDQIKRARPDAKLFSYAFGGFNLVMRVDQPPFNDKRVRQALSMAIDRKALRDAVTKGEGEPDQVFTWTVKTWGFRKPSDLGDAAKYWTYDPKTAKQLLSAAGVTGPIETQLAHWDATVIGQGLVDIATLIESQWRDQGIANVKDVSQTFAQYATSTNVGNFDGMFVGPTGGGAFGTEPGIQMKSVLWSPAEGVKVPTTNNAHITDQRLSALIEKQLTQLKLEERKQTFKQIEELMEEEQYRIVLNTYGNHWFVDPSVQDIQMPIYAVNGSLAYVKTWWFDKV